MPFRVVVCPLDTVDGHRRCRPASLVDGTGRPYRRNVLSAPPPVEWCVAWIYGKGFGSIESDPDCVTMMEFNLKEDAEASLTPAETGMTAPQFQAFKADVERVTGVALTGTRNQLWRKYLNDLVSILQPNSEPITLRGPRPVRDDR